MYTFLSESELIAFIKDEAAKYTANFVFDIKHKTTLI